MVSTTAIQFFRADDLSQNGYNTRAIYQEFGKNRGSIFVHQNASGAEKIIASSMPADDSFRYQRVYEDALAYSGITGFYSIANKADRGIEAALNAELNGDIPELAISNVTDFIMQKEPRGADVHLSINDSLQQAAYQALASSGYRGAIVAIEPQTGRILALASFPSLDYNTFAVHDTQVASQNYSAAATQEDDPMMNRATDELYPPGSTFKVITAASALTSGRYQPSSIIPAPLRYQLPGTATDLPNYADGNCHATSGQETMLRALEQSCNTAFAMLGVDVGQSIMRNVSSDFGYGESFTIATSPFGYNSDYAFKTQTPIFPTNLTDDRLALASIGQGDVKTTPFQDCLISAIVANDGYLANPHLIDSITDSSGKVLFESEKVLVKNDDNLRINPTFADQIKDMMFSDVANGIASYAGVKGVKVAGKTGTAENATDKNPHGWFTGFAPVDDPKIALAVFLENGVIGTNAAKIASNIFKHYLLEDLGGSK
ncbi:MAG: penicillin-binding protein 2 [Candidatus Ancillula sp.]|jgi:peptidoglycan glycosyltransferase|nr:penicillin-binding protein 2 [Candidatus Ancillula sp.]